MLTFAKNIHNFSPYGYWRILSSLYIKGGYDIPLEVWKKMFSMSIPEKKNGLMTADELKVYTTLPQYVKAYRIHKAKENDWISYTLSLQTALNFVESYSEQCVYGGMDSCLIDKRDILAFFGRRKEQEIIVLDKNKMINAKKEMF